MALFGQSKRVRAAAVAGSFYPSDPAQLRAIVESMLEQARTAGDEPSKPPKAIITPHAGYIYSGPTAAHAYLQLSGGRASIRRVILLGPSHFVPLRGLALPRSSAFETPLGLVPMDPAAEARLRELAQVSISDAPHAREHSLEVQLPFLQVVLDEFELVPLVVGESPGSETGAVLDQFWGGEETVIVISTDLSHYHDYDTARGIDQRTAEAIETLSTAEIQPEQACGCRPLNGMIDAARRHGLTPSRLDLRSSGDTAGPRDAVVGYGAWALTEPQEMAR